jgi:tetratricopeptide (TPR) repeat protein
MEEDIYTLIERYLAGELNPDENKAIEDRIKSDQDFAEKVALYRSLSENLKSRFSGEQDEQRLRESLQAISKTEIAKKSGKVISFQWYHWAAAASIALLGIFWFYTTTPTLPHYSQYAFHGSLSLAERGDDSLAHKAEDAFNSAKYEQAVPFFDQLLEAEPDNTELKLYKGVSLLEVDRYKEAESIFLAVRESNTIYRDKAIWYLALSALKQKDYDKCKTYLDQLSPDSEDHSKAKEILEEL